MQKMTYPPKILDQSFDRETNFIIGLLICLSFRLSSQLDNLLKATKSIQSTWSGLSPGPSILTADCKNFVVGRIHSHANSTTHFFTDRVEYHVHHPTEGKIFMMMFYKDMANVNCHHSKMKFQFKIVHALHLFGQDYDHLNAHDILSIEFASLQGLLDFEKQVVHKIKACAL